MKRIALAVAIVLAALAAPSANADVQIKEG